MPDKSAADGNGIAVDSSYEMTARQSSAESPRLLDDQQQHIHERQLRRGTSLFRDLDVGDAGSRQHLHRMFYQSKTFHGVCIVTKGLFLGLVFIICLVSGLGGHLVHVIGGFFVAGYVGFLWLYALVAAFWSRLYR